MPAPGGYRSCPTTRLLRLQPRQQLLRPLAEQPISQLFSQLFGFHGQSRQFGLEKLMATRVRDNADDLDQFTINLSPCPYGQMATATEAFEQTALALHLEMRRHIIEELVFFAQGIIVARLDGR